MKESIAETKPLVLKQLLEIEASFCIVTEWVPMDTAIARNEKATLLWLAARYAFVEKSILVVTEGLGERKFHGRVVLLVNEHTASAGEMVSAFAEENNLAVIVGTKTPGRLLSGSAFKVGRGYILGLPVAAYLTWQGRMLENNGIAPSVVADLSREALREGKDTQLENAVEVIRNL